MASEVKFFLEHDLVSCRHMLSNSLCRAFQVGWTEFMILIGQVLGYFASLIAMSGWINWGKPSEVADCGGPWWHHDGIKSSSNSRGRKFYMKYLCLCIIQ